MARSSNITPTKAPESVTARMMAKILKVPPAETVEEVATAYIDVGTNNALKTLLGEVYGLYPWMVVDVASEIMAPDTSPMTEHLFSMAGSVFVLKDSRFSGNDSLWLATADPMTELLMSTCGFVNRALLRTSRLPDGSLSQLLAIQLNSCQP